MLPSLFLAVSTMFGDAAVALAVVAKPLQSLPVVLELAPVGFDLRAILAELLKVALKFLAVLLGLLLQLLGFLLVFLLVGASPGLRFARSGGVLRLREGRAGESARERRR